MNLSREAMLDLMAYADGELDVEATKRVEALLAANADARRVVDDMRTLGECVRVSEGERQLPEVDLAGRVMQGVAAEMDLARAAEPKVLKFRRAIPVAAVCTFLAVAAAWVIFVRSPRSDGEPIASTGARAGEIVSAIPQVDIAIPQALVELAHEVTAVRVQPDKAIDPIGGVDLEHLEARSDVSIFYVPAVAAADENASSVVVWLGEEGR